MFALFTSPAGLPRIDPLKNFDNQRGSGKASALRRTFRTDRRPEIVRRCSRALLGWLRSVAAVVRAFRMVATARIRALPRSPSVPDEASLSLLLRGLCSLTRVSSLVLMVSQALSVLSSCSRSLWRRAHQRRVHGHCLRPL